MAGTAVDGGAPPALVEQSIPSAGQSPTGTKLDKVIVALMAQKDEIRAVSTNADADQAVCDHGGQSQNMLTQLYLDSQVAALEVAVRDGPGVGGGTGAAAPEASAPAAPPAKKAKGALVPGFSPPPRAPASASPRAASQARCALLAAPWPGRQGAHPTAKSGSAGSRTRS